MTDDDGWNVDDREVTHLTCPVAERVGKGDNTTHHMVTRPNGEQRCRYCNRTRPEILRLAAKT